ncbi:unnamed protein product [Choristocarpus tenellus]
MRLITHNMLKSNIRQVQGYPLGIEVVKVVSQELEFDKDFVFNMLGKLEWSVFREAAVTLGAGDNLPEKVDEELRSDDAFLQKVHHALLEVHLIEGELVCPETGRKFPVREGVPNMLLHEDGELGPDMSRYFWGDLYETSGNRTFTNLCPYHSFLRVSIGVEIWDCEDRRLTIWNCQLTTHFHVCLY